MSSSRAVKLSVCCLTVDPPAQVATSLSYLRPLADEIVVLVDSRVDADALGAYVDVADRVFRYEFRPPVDRPRAWLHGQCHGDWIMSIDGDEVPSRRMIDELPGLVAATDVQQYLFPRRWLFGEATTWLGELPWWPDFQVRLVRNDATLAVPGGIHGGIVPVLPARYVEAPLYHLDTLVTSESDRRAKADAYEAYEPGRQAYGGGPLNETLYLPERRRSARLRDVPAEDRPWIDDVLRARSRAGPSGLVETPLVPAEEIDDLAPDCSLPALAYHADLSLFDDDPRMAPGERRPFYLRIRSDGAGSWPWWPWGSTKYPPVRISYHWRTVDGEPLAFENLRTPLPARLAPGDTQIVPVWVDAPAQSGRYLLEFDVVHEMVRWFEQPLAVEVQVAERDAC
jgi:hypothetical protein